MSEQNRIANCLETGQGGLVLLLGGLGASGGVLGWVTGWGLGWGIAFLQLQGGEV